MEGEGRERITHCNFMFREGEGGGRERAERKRGRGWRRERKGRGRGGEGEIHFAQNLELSKLTSGNRSTSALT